MGTYPLTDRPTPIFDLLKTRPTIFIEEPLVKKLDGEELPERGFGLVTGRAGERRGGKPRTFLERLKRHELLSKRE